MGQFRWQVSSVMALLLAGCGASATLERPLDVQQQRTRAGSGADGHTYLSTHLLPRDGQGQPLPCDEGTFEVTVEVSTDGEQTWSALDSGAVTLACDGETRGDLAVVLDNSGSTANVLSLIDEGADDLLGDLLAAGGRGGLVRVSTNAEVLVELTDDDSALSSGLDELVVESNGYTALWDGVRMGNEVLGGEIVQRVDAPVHDDLGSFCGASEPLGVLVFTDGHENNSADEQDYDHDRFPGDGYATTLADLQQLHVGGQTTPVYTIGLGDEPDHDALQAVADATGGVHQRVDHPNDVVDTFALVGDYLTGTHQVCADLDEEVCGALSVRVSWSWTAEGRTAPEHEGTEVQAVTVDCPSEPATGTRALLLMTLTNPHLPEADAATLTTNTVAHVSPTAAPQVLVVLDDNHHGEFEGDADQVATWLGDAGYAVTRLDETGDGLTDTDVEGYDVVWLSNPGYPPDDLATIEVLEAFTAAGGGLVLQGDDMTRGWSNAFSMTSLTSLVYEHNGVKTCGETTDDNQGERFEVSTFDGHPMLAGLESQTWFYGDDIDQTTPLDEGEQVLAEATLEIDPGCTVTPALVAYDP